MAAMKSDISAGKMAAVKRIDINKRRRKYQRKMAKKQSNQRQWRRRP